MSGRKDWFFVSDAAKSFLRTALAEADAQGALAILAEVHRGFDFRPVLAAGTGNVTRRDIAVIRDCQDWREERNPKSRADIDVEAPPEAPGLDARDTGATPPAKAPPVPPRPPKPPAVPPVPPTVAPDAVAKAAKHSAGTPPTMPPQTAPEALAGVSVTRALTRKNLPPEVRAKLRDWFLANQKDADHVDAIAVLEGRA